jgi:hypothetical protein
LIDPDATLDISRVDERKGHPEFRGYAWLPLTDLLVRSAGFRRPVYKQLADFLRSDCGTQPPRVSSDHTADFLLAEHRYFSDSFWRNEETGEKRVNFLITLVTAVLAALAALASHPGSLTTAQIGGFTFAACFALFVVGVLTFVRLIHRNRAADKYKACMDSIRSYLGPRDELGLSNYHPFPPIAARAFGRGGLTDIVAAVDSFIAAAGLAGLAALSGSLVAVSASAAAGFVVSFALHRGWINRTYRSVASTPPERDSCAESTACPVDEEDDSPTR